MNALFSPPRIIVALDFADPAEALRFARRLDPAHCRLKVGKELFTRGGTAVVERLVGSGFELFLDLKFHDIPNTVAGACRAAAELGVWMVNVHALGGRRMMEAAREAIEAGAHRPLLTAVTILTSMGERDIHEIGLTGSPQENVNRLAALAHAAGMDGVVCSHSGGGAEGGGRLSGGGATGDPRCRSLAGTAAHQRGAGLNSYRLVPYDGYDRPYPSSRSNPSRSSIFTSRISGRPINALGSSPSSRSMRVTPSPSDLKLPAQP